MTNTPPTGEPAAVRRSNKGCLVHALLMREFSGGGGGAVRASIALKSNAMPNSRTAEGKSAAEARAAARGLKSTFVGVTWKQSSSWWRRNAIMHNGANHRIGRFDDEQEAAWAYVNRTGA